MRVIDGSLPVFLAWPVSMRRPLVLTLSLLVSGGCTSYRPIRISQPSGDISALGQTIRINETVKLHLRSGREVKMTVARVELETVVGTRGERIPAADVASVERLSFNLGRTVLAVLGIFVLGGGIAAAAILASGQCLVCI